LEYSVERDAVFCFACRRFPPIGSKEMAFSVNGFRNWKRALGDPNKGLLLHNNSPHHLSAMAMWVEYQRRTSQKLSVSTLVNDSILEKHRYYVQSIAETIQFLAVNELAFRGDQDPESCSGHERGLFRHLFQLLLRKDKKLEDIQKIIPQNASYCSPEIQNDVIATLAEIVTESVAADIKSADVPW
jgi:hypothetical protein